MSYKHGKAKQLNWSGYGTRKSWNNLLGNTLYPRSDCDVGYQTDSNRSKRRKYLEKVSNRKIRRLPFFNSSGGQYKKIYNLKRELD